MFRVEPLDTVHKLNARKTLNLFPVFMGKTFDQKSRNQTEIMSRFPPVSGNGQISNPTFNYNIVN